MQSRRQVLVVDDDADCCALMVDILAEAGYEVSFYLSGEQALDALQRRRFDLILSDIKMPGITGIDLLLRVREMGLTTAFILVTAYASLQTAVDALRGQAFDYIIKPFAVGDFRQRVAAALEKPGPGSQGNIRHYLDLTIDLNAHRVQVGDCEVKLTRLEFGVLAYLFERQGCTVSPEELLRAVWDSKPDERTTDSVKSCIRRLRKKIEADTQTPRYIVNVWGVGYQLGE